MSDDTLTPAAEMAKRGSKPFPNESDRYRQARTKLLAQEIELRRQIERVAALRRALPPGGEAKDYRFVDENGTEVRLADLFGRHDGQSRPLCVYDETLMRSDSSSVSVKCTRFGNGNSAWRSVMRVAADAIRPLSDVI